MFNFKDKDEFHHSLKNYSSDYILSDEIIVVDVRVNNHTYIYTNKRLIVFQVENIILNSNTVESYYYNDISSVKYGNYLVGSNKYVTLDFKFIVPNKRLTLDFPEDVVFDISNKVDNFTS